jgi:formylmethanofuran dehydrogenase subunit B
MTSPDRVERITCLGCGCGCDDVTVTVREGRIVEADPVCPIEKVWLGDGSVPWEVQRDGRPVTIHEALAEAATVLTESRGRALVYLAPDLTSQAQRQAVAIADILKATVDSATSHTAAAGLLAAQRRGRATATLGEVRNRADVLLFWGVDPRQRYPRYVSRYALDPAGTHVPTGRAGRFVISVSIGADKGPTEADLTIALESGDEIAALSLMRAAVSSVHPGGELSPGLRQAVALVPRLTGARYAVLVHDAEPTTEQRNPLRVEGLIALAQALNGPTRAALSSLRAGGNRPGAESVLTWQTGYPFAVDYSRGHPRYSPGERGLDRLVAGSFSAALVVGAPAVAEQATAALSRIKTVAIGPRASEAAFKTRVAIDTGVAGIHEGGTAYRMDEVPLPLRPPLAGRRSAAETLQALTDLLRTRLEGSRE